MVRTIVVSRPYHLSVRNEHILLEPKMPEDREGQLTAEDVGFLVLEHPMISFTMAVMELCAAHNVAVIFCGKQYLPISMLLHLETHGVQSERFRSQLDASEPLRKQLWAQTVKAKINNQADLLSFLEIDAADIAAMAKQVKSGDADNQEAQAARRYWPRLFGASFTRERFGESPNHALNYGYTILRAAVARALCGRGLLPLMGIHHRNRYNHYALADDIMEPYRSWVDYTVWQLNRSGQLPTELDRHCKATLLGLLTMDVWINGQKTNLMQALEATCTSLAQCFEGSVIKIRYPNFQETMRGLQDDD